MIWPPPQIPADGASSPSTPTPRTRRRNRVAPALAISAVGVLAAALFVATRDGSGKDGGDGAGTGTGTGTATTAIGPDGGRVAIADSDATGGGISLDVPAGALSTSTTITLSTSPRTVDDLRGLADEQPEVWSGLADYALDDSSTLLDPVFGPLVLAGLTQLTGPVIEFGPNGLRLTEPAEVVVPLDLLDFPDGTVPVVLLQGDDGWEIVDGAVVDVTRGVLRFDVNHFSRSFIGRILSNMVSNPTASATPAQYQQALETLAAGPSEAVSDGVMRAILCRDRVSFDATAIPDASTILDYLGFESVRISRAPSGAGNRIRDVLRAHFNTSLAANNRTPHDYSFDALMQLAMNETNGDPFQALVLAHDVLRDNRNSPSVQGVMQNVRGDNGDENGARYHLLGTAVYAFAYEYLRASNQTGTFWPPRAETVVRWEEAWVSGDIRTDTVEYAVDRLGARLGRDLYREYAALAAGHRSEFAELLCAGSDSSTTTTTTEAATTTTIAETTTTTTTPPEVPTSTVPPDIVLGTGDVQATLLWSGESDMDLHVVEPDGEETYFQSPASSTGGVLDHDDIAGCGADTGTHVENIFWPQGLAPPGDYRAYVHFYTACAEGASQSVQLTVTVNGQVVVSQAIILVGGGTTSNLYDFSVG